MTFLLLSLPSGWTTSFVQYWDAKNLCVSREGCKLNFFQVMHQTYNSKPKALTACRKRKAAMCFFKKKIPKYGKQF